MEPSQALEVLDVALQIVAEDPHDDRGARTGRFTVGAIRRAEDALLEHIVDPVPPDFGACLRHAAIV